MREPTLKQQKAIENAVENGGNISKAMRDAGYSPATAKNPDKLTKSDAWQELMEKYLPDEKLLEVGEEGLDAWKIHSSHTEPDKQIPDYQTRAKYLELALKLKKRLGPDIVTNTQINADQITVAWGDGDIV